VRVLYNGAVCGGVCYDSSLITHGLLPFITMACNACGHPNDAHQYVTSSLFYCSECKILESHVAFSEETGANPSKSEDALTDLYKAFKK
jgi:hypothetical protein